MEIVINSTINTPEVRIEPGKVEIKGRSIPEDSFDFYLPVIEYITSYLKLDLAKTEVVVYLEYINSSSKKFLTAILNLFEESYLNGKEIYVIWQYDEDDEAIYELGNDIKSFIKLPIQLEEIIL
jgi:hypothetical protein